MNVSVLFGVACIHAHTCTRAPGGTSLFGFTSQLGRTNMYSDTYLPTHPPTHTYPHAHTRTPGTGTRAQIYTTCARSRTPTALARALLLKRASGRTRALAHTHTRTHTGTHTHTHTLDSFINSGSLVEMLDCGKRIGPTPRICHSWQEQNNETTAPFEGTRGTQVRPEASLRMSAHCLDPVRWAVDQGMRTAPLPSLSFPSEQGFHTHTQPPAMLGASKQHTQGAKGTTAKNQRNRVRKRRVR